ncbi:integrator complex subunit 12 [Corythoichthys intestinalis]|uniref:integrator complex subunit 12 n=1 Tax=Corythoichthys intestinalis TaxID=161448 RepID=UPI0025A64468|nr:integrator complex subunit 12 [Corythoichthys intestinalis]XP_061791340.1 integrator complex subunit 12-like [Nerophis lumbriciformis]
MAAPVSLELDPIFLKGLSYLHSKSKDSAEKLKALLDESLSRGSDTSYRLVQKDLEVKGSVSKLSFSKQDSKSSSSSSSSLGSKSSSEKSKKDTDRRSSEKVRVELGDVDPPKKLRLEKQDRSSPVTVQTSKDLLPNINDYDETNADDFAMEMGLACVVCRQMTVSMGNQLVECQECHNLYHQDCHKPQVTDKEVNDPRLVWYCARCTRQMKRMAQKPPQKPSPASASSAPVVIKDTLVKKTEFKTKLDTTSTFQAFKRTEVKTSTTSANPTSSNSSTSGSGLTGWAAFGAKTSPSLSINSKLGSSGSSGSNKAMATPPGQKPVGLSSLAGNKSGLGATKVPGSGNGNGATQLSLKPPPLTLGKQPLNRSSSSESQGKGSVSSSGAASPGSSQASPGSSGTSGNNNGGNNGNNGNGSKVLPGDKAPTSQESQLHAMKRLQLVKKKAAQKKLKK